MIDENKMLTNKLHYFNFYNENEQYYYKEKSCFNKNDYDEAKLMMLEFEKLLKIDERHL